MESAFVEKARRWVVENYPYNRDHLIRALEWLDRLSPGVDEAVRLAALTHDMERAFPGPDSPAMHSLADPVYERLHSERSARIAGIKHVHEQRVFVGLVPLGSHPSVDLDVQCPKERPAQSPGAQRRAAEEIGPARHHRTNSGRKRQWWRSAAPLELGASRPDMRPLRAACNGNVIAVDYCLDNARRCVCSAGAPETLSPTVRGVGGSSASDF